MTNYCPEAVDRFNAAAATEQDSATLEVEAEED